MGGVVPEKNILRPVLASDIYLNAAQMKSARQQGRRLFKY